MHGDLSDEEMAAKVFRQFDIDDSGSLDRDELRRMLRQLGLPDSVGTVRRLLDTYDVDGSGLISEDEFLLFLNGLREEAEKAATHEGQIRYTRIAGSKQEQPYLPPSYLDKLLDASAGAMT